MRNKLTLFAILILITASISFAQTPVYVDASRPDNSGDGLSALTAKKTITAGLATVASSGTVLVAAGSYAENLVITQPVLLLSSSGAATTTISASGGTAVTINSSNVSIQGFTITNPMGQYGISSNNFSDILLSNNIITGIGSGVSSPSSNSFGISISGTSTAISNITIVGNTINAIYGGILANRTRSATGIVIGFSNGSSTITGLQIQDNNISDIKGSIPSVKGAYGILINYGSSSTGSVVSPYIANNTISDLDGEWSHGIGMEANTPNAVISGNTFSNIIANKTYDKYAVFFESNSSIGTVQVNQNNFNSAYGIGIHSVLFATLTTEILNAENNWWGNVSGPSGTGLTGTGAALGTESSIASITAHLDYSPWLGAVVGTVPMTYYGNPADPTYVADAIASAQNGDEVVVHTGTYNAFTVNKEVILLAEPGTIISHGSPAIIVNANNVTIDGFAFNYVAPDYAIQINPNFTGTIIRNCNISTPNGVDNQSTGSVIAINNYWGFGGNFSGPTIASNPGGTGSVINQNPGSVSYDPWVGKTTSPVTSYTGTPINGFSITWNWLSFFGPNFGFRLDHNGVPGSDINTTVATNSYTIAAPLLYNTTYHWYVKSQTDPLNIWIGPFSFTTIPGPPTLISPSNLSKGISVTPTLSWNSVAGANLYRVTIIGFGAPLPFTTASTSVVLPVLTAGVVYTWFVEASNNAGATWSPVSASWNFTTEYLLAPTNLSAGVSIIPSFDWLDVPGAALYTLQIATDNAFSNIVLAQMVIQSTYALLPSQALTNGATYYWRVLSNNGVVSGTWSFIVVQPAMPYLTNPSSGSTIVGDIIYFAWYVVGSAATNFTLEVDDANDFLTPIQSFAISASGQYNWTYTGLTPGSTYYWRITSKTSGGLVVNYSSTWTFVAPGMPNVFPSYPSGGVTVYTTAPTLYYYTGTYYNGQFEVRYATSSSVNGSGMLNDLSAVSAPLTPNLFVTLPALSPTTYYWQVRSVNGLNAGTWCAVQSFVIYSATSTPVVPYLSYPTGGATVYTNPPTLYWYIGTYAPGLQYQIRYATNASVDGGGMLNNGSASNFVSLTSNLYSTFGSLLTSGTYYWQVRSYNGVTYSNWSSVESFVISNSNNSISMPVASYPSGGITIYQLNPTLSYYAYSSSPLEYRINYSAWPNTDINGVLNIANTSSLWTASTNYVLSGLTPGVTYYWQVQARLAATPATISSWSSIVSFITAAGSFAVVPQIGSPNYGQPINNTSAVLSWVIPTQSSSPLKYELQYSDKADMSNAKTVSNLATPTYQVSGLNKNSLYYWRVSSKNETGKSDFSPIGSFKTNAITGIDEQSIPTEYTLEQNYPNPFNPTTIINYSLPNNSLVTLKVFDMLGREVKTLVSKEIVAGKHSIEWKGDDNSGNKVATGVYVYRISAGSFTSSKKMLLIK